MAEWTGVDLSIDAAPGRHDHVIMWSKDLQRTVDYLQTRSDVAHDKIGYVGRSWGAAMGTIMVATEPRLKLAIFYVGGFYSQHARPEVEATNFAPRVVVPSLMLNGRYDFFFPVESSQRFMFHDRDARVARSLLRPGRGPVTRAKGKVMISVR